VKSQVLRHLDLAFWLRTLVFDGERLESQRQGRPARGAEKKVGWEKGMVEAECKIRWEKTCKAARKKEPLRFGKAQSSRSVPT
jgi:hypothetical protein